MPRAVGRRDEIHQTFIRHVAERGYELANLGAIATELGMSKGTIVHHFGAKAQMLRELEESYMRRQLDAVHLMWDRLAAPEERIAAIIYGSALLHELDRDATVATQREVVQLADDPQMQEVRKLRAEMQGLTIAELERGVEENVFRPVNVEVTNLQLWGSLQWLWVWFDPSGSMRPEDVGAAFTDVFVRGLLVKPDRLAADLTDPDGALARVVRECLTAGRTTD